MALKLQQLTAAAPSALAKLARSRTASARAVARAHSLRLARGGRRVPAMAQAVAGTASTVRPWLPRFQAAGRAGVPEQPRAGRPAPSQPAQVSAGMATAL